MSRRHEEIIFGHAYAFIICPCSGQFVSLLWLSFQSSILEHVVLGLIELTQPECPGRFVWLLWFPLKAISWNLWHLDWLSSASLIFQRVPFYFHFDSQCADTKHGRPFASWWVGWRIVCARSILLRVCLSVFVCICLFWAWMYQYYWYVEVFHGSGFSYLSYLCIMYYVCMFHDLVRLCNNMCILPFWTCLILLDKKTELRWYIARRMLYVICSCIYAVW